MNMKMNKQYGFLTLAAVIIIILFGLVSAFLVYVYTVTQSQATYLNNAKQAASLAESAYEQATSGLTQSVIANRNKCSYTTSTTPSGGTGLFSISNTGYWTSTTLPTGFSNAATPSSLTLTSTASFAPYGRFMIGTEAFTYTNNSTGTNTLTGITRAQDGTRASTYANGTIVSQYQCTINGTGQAPGATTPNGQRLNHTNVTQPMLYAVGDTGTIFQWNPATPAGSELQWVSMSESPVIALNINAVSALNYHDAWFAANLAGGNIFQLGRLQNNSWSSFTLSIAGNVENNLNGIYATSTQEAWAVGDRTRSGNLINILRWINNGTNLTANWCVVPTAAGAGCASKTRNETGIANAAKFFLGVKAIDTNNDGFADIGYAVGGQPGTAGSTANRGVVMEYNGSTWTLLSPNITANSSVGQLFGVDLTRPVGANKEAFYVGGTSNTANAANPGVIVRDRNSGTFLIRSTTAPNNITQILNAVSVLDTNNDGFAEIGCAVGRGGLVVTFDSSLTLTKVTLSGVLTGVTVLSPTNIWVVGDGGVVYNYDGSCNPGCGYGVAANWKSINTGIGGTNLNGVTGIFPTTPIGDWHDLTN